ncbi:MAG: N-acetylmuramoyl-L-alanine amidase [Acidimicrobiia bacterium]
MCDHSFDRRRFLSGTATTAAAAGVAALVGRSPTAAALPAPSDLFESDGMGEDPWPAPGLVAAGLRSADALTAAGLPRVAVSPPPIITRAQWGADESLRTIPRSFAPLTKFVIHHTAGPNDPIDPAAQVRAAYAFHTEGRDFADIGYHFLIDHNGSIYEGRWARDYAPGEVHSGEDQSGNLVIGAHTLGHNTGACGIALLGTFTDANPTPKAIESLVRLIAWKAGPRGIDPLGSDPYLRVGDQTTITFGNIVGHRDLAATACPGATFHPQLAQLRLTVAARLRRGLIGYRILTSDGSVLPFGAIGDVGDPRRFGVRNSVAIAAAPDPDGYYALGPDGGVFAFGSAAFRGSAVGKTTARAVDLAVAPDGSGYWVCTADGGIVPVGVPDLGSLTAIGVRNTALRIRPTPSGRGYWILGLDGGVFCFGDAQYYGSVPGLGIRTQVVDIAPTPTGAGYWILGRDGGVFCFGDAAFWGSLGGGPIPWQRPAMAMMASPEGTGYHLLAADGGVFSFGSVPFFGSSVGRTTAAPIAIAQALSTAPIDP